MLDSRKANGPAVAGPVAMENWLAAIVYRSGTNCSTVPPVRLDKVALDQWLAIAKALVQRACGAVAGRRGGDEQHHPGHMRRRDQRHAELQTLAVMHISAIPPGAVARIRLAIEIPADQPRPAANNADTAIATTTLASTPAT